MDKSGILSALSVVGDPQTGHSIVSRQMVENIEIDGNKVQLSLVLPSLHMPNKTDLIFACIGAIQDVYAQADVHVHTIARAAETATEKETTLPQVRNIIAVGSGKGGVGKSTVAVNLALALLDMGAKVGIMDADLYGPSIPTMLGLQGIRPDLKDVYGTPKMVPLEAYGLHVMSIGNIVEPEQAIVLRGPRLAGIIKQFVNDTLWPPLDYLIVDLPPGTGDIQLTLVQTVPVTGMVVVTTPQEVAVIDAVKAINMFLLPQIDVPILGVVENMSWFTPEELPDSKYYIFGQGGGKRLAQMSNSMLLGQIPLVQGIRESGDMGKPVVLHNEPITKRAFMEAAQNLARQVVIRHEMLPPTQKVSMQE